MRLCYLASASSVHTAKWAKYFGGKGHQVHVVSFELERNLGPNVEIHRLGRHLPFKMHYFCRARTLRRVLQTIEPEILHAHYASGYATLGRLSRFHPYVVSAWGSDVFEFAKKSPIHRKIVRANLASADRVCSTSRVMAEEIRSYCNLPIDLTPFGVDCEQFHPTSRNNGVANDFVVGVVKALEPIYGIDYLIRGFAIASKRNTYQRKMRLLIAGGGSLRESLGNLARELGVEGQTTFLGPVAHDSVPSVLAQFSVFVAPSIGPESFGVAVVEASACGLPVIASNIGGLPEIVQDRATGILVPPRDPDAIAAALDELISDESLRSGLGRSGRKFVLENYEWSESAARMQRVYDSLLTTN